MIVTFAPPLPLVQFIHVVRRQPTSTWLALGLVIAAVQLLAFIAVLQGHATQGERIRAAQAAHRATLAAQDLRSAAMPAAPTDRVGMAIVVTP